MDMRLYKIKNIFISKKIRVSEFLTSVCGFYTHENCAGCSAICVGIGVDNVQSDNNYYIDFVIRRNIDYHLWDIKTMEEAEKYINFIFENDTRDEMFWETWWHNMEIEMALNRIE